MKNEIIFAIIAVVGALALYLFDKEALAVGFLALVWGVYEKFTKTEIKKENENLKAKNEFLKANK